MGAQPHGRMRRQCGAACLAHGAQSGAGSCMRAGDTIRFDGGQSDRHKKSASREMIEGPDAWERFRDAMKAIIKVPKRAMPPSPFKTTTKKKQSGRMG